MRTCFLFIILVCCSVWVKAQEKRLYFSAYTTFDYSNILPEESIDHRGKFSFGIGIQGNYRFSSKWEGIIAVAFIDKGHRRKSIDPGPDDGIEVYVSSNALGNISVPVKIQYNISQSEKKLWYVATGVENDFNVNQSGNFYPNDFSISATFNGGVRFPLSKKLHLGLEPTFRYPLSPYTKKIFGRPEISPYSVGLKVLLRK